MKKKVGAIAFASAVAVGGFLAMPSQYYLRRALINLKPDINQYPIFANRKVKATNPMPWPKSKLYNTGKIPKKFLPEFKKYKSIAFAVFQHGQLLFDTYWEGSSPASHSNSFSMAKSIISLGIGCAIDDGFIKSVNQPVSDFFPAFKAYDHKALTIKHLLTMSAGTDFEEAYSSPFSPTTKLYYGNDLQKIAMEMNLIEEPGVNFIYQSGVTQLLAFILKKATGETISDYISRRLFSPIGAEHNALWSLDKKGGMEKAFCCFNSNALDFARFGQLILNQGRWEGKQIVSADYIKAAITPDTSLIFKEHNEPNKVYGYQFWKCQYDGYQIPLMRGILGQYVYIVPEKDAVIVRLGHKRSQQRDEQHFTIDQKIWFEAGLALLNQANAEE